MKNVLREFLLRVEEDFTQEYKNMIPCRKSNEHSWIINSLHNQTNIRLIDVDCRYCMLNLAVTLRMFAGVQDHG